MGRHPNSSDTAILDIGIFRWANVVAHYDNKDNVYPKKERPKNKMDGAIALIMALGRAMMSSSEDSETIDYHGLWSARA
jgi:phage terminase large subunit-like protein